MKIMYRMLDMRSATASFQTEYALLFKQWQMMINSTLKHRVLGFFLWLDKLSM